ncbi:MAG: hypothetical protein AAGA76_05920 [Pseudomonadota bacterium]
MTIERRHRWKLKQAATDAKTSLAASYSGLTRVSKRSPKEILSTNTIGQFSVGLRVDRRIKSDDDEKRKAFEGMAGALKKFTDGAAAE